MEVPSGSDEEVVRAARDADALYGKVCRITKRIIDGLERYKMSCVNPSVLEGTELRRRQPYSVERGPGA